MTNLFQLNTGSERIYNKSILVVFSILMLVVGFLISYFSLMAAIFLMASPLIVFFFIKLFKDPSVGLVTAIIFNFFALGLSRYVDAPFGLAIDALLVLSILSLAFSSYKLKPDYSLLKNDVMYLSVIWMLYLILELANPEASSRSAWFFFMRGMGLYMLLAIFLVLTVYNKPENLEKFLFIWAVLSFIGILKGLGQKYIGLDHWEQYWLTTEGFKTHFVFRQLEYN